MPSRAEMFADRPTGGKEALGMPGRLEATHGAFTLTGRLMRVLRAIVEPPVATMFNARHDLLLRCVVTAEFVGDEHARDVRAAFEQLAEELLRCGFVASTLHQND